MRKVVGLLGTFNSDFSSVMFAPFVCGTGGAKYPVTARDVFPSLFPHYFLPLFPQLSMSFLIAEGGPSFHRERMGRVKKKLGE